MQGGGSTSKRLPVVLRDGGKLVSLRWNRILRSKRERLQSKGDEERLREAG